MSLAGIQPELLRVPHALIDEPELPSRSDMDERLLDDLVENMLANGFTSSVVLFRNGDRFGTVAGHRRWHAAKRAGIGMIPALVYPSETEGLEAIQFSENEHRENLSPADEAIWYAQLYEKRPEHGTDGLAARLKVPHARVQNRLALLYGDEEIFAALKADKIRVGVAEQLNRCARQDYRRLLLDNAIRNGATVATVSGWISEWKATMEPALANVPIAGGPPVTTGITLPDYFTCHLCGLKENPANMRPVNIHDYCVKAVLDPALEQFRQRRDYVRWPRTVDEARAHIEELLERFPTLGADAVAQP
jgi:ParB/RepB/Spo0J family partition protein